MKVVKSGTVLYLEEEEETEEEKEDILYGAYGE